MQFFLRGGVKRPPPLQLIGLRQKMLVLFFHFTVYCIYNIYVYVYMNLYSLFYREEQLGVHVQEALEFAVTFLLIVEAPTAKT